MKTTAHIDSIANTLLAAAVALLLNGSSCAADDSVTEDHTTIHDIKVDGDDVDMVLRIYANFSGFDLVEASDVKQVHVPLWFHSAPGRAYSQKEAAKLLQKVLLDQAGIIITPLDDERASVTYNDQLPKKKVKEK